MVKAYPDRCAQHEQAMQQKITPAYSGQTGSGGSSRKTEDTVVHAMSRTNTREYESVHLAIRQTEQKQSGDLRLQLIELVYWKNTHTLYGAARVVHVSFRTAQRWHSEFIYLVARNYGLMD